MNSKLIHSSLKLTILETWFRLGHLGNPYVYSYLRIRPMALTNVVKEYNQSEGFLIVGSKMNYELLAK